MKNIQSGFFDTENRYERLTQLGDPLEKLNGAIDWEMFRNRPINQRWRTKKRGRNPTSKKYQAVKMEVPVYRNETA